MLQDHTAEVEKAWFMLHKQWKWMGCKLKYSSKLTHPSPTLCGSLVAHTVYQFYKKNSGSTDTRRKIKYWFRKLSSIKNWYSQKHHIKSLWPHHHILIAQTVLWTDPRKLLNWNVLAYLLVWCQLYNNLVEHPPLG